MYKRFVNIRVPGEGNSTVASELVVSGGRVSSLPAAGIVTAGGDEQWINLGGALVLPGVIDSHVHFDDPGYTHREDFTSGTCAAAAGGVTCVVDMPCTSKPPVTTTEALQAKLRAIQRKAHVDFMLWGGVSSDALELPDWRAQLAALVDAGVAAIKVYTLSGMDTFGELTYPQIRQVLEEASTLAIPVGVHAEDAATVDACTARVMTEGGTGAIDYAASRPAEAECVAVEAVAEACQATGARVHIVHLSSGKALDLISQARANGADLSAETCPHFLEHTVGDLERLGASLKTAPVVKGAQDRDRLWQGLANAELAFVASDHAAAQWPEEKHTGSIWTDYAGVPGVELLLPYLYSEGVCTGRITLQRLTELTSVEPARFLGVDHRKGRLEPGCDADFVVFDESETWTVRADDLHNLNRYTPLEGHTLTGRVRAVYLRGQCVYRRCTDGTELFAPAGTGKWVKRRRNRAGAGVRLG